MTQSIAYGGVVINGSGRILLRRPRNLWGGYAWTFPKGGPSSGETGAQAALREVREETGVEAEIIARVPGEFPGTTAVASVFFLMSVVHDHGDFQLDETEAVAWATPDGARSMIGETPSPTGRKRDVAVLEAALDLAHGTGHRLSIPRA